MNLDLPLEDCPDLLDEHGPIFILGCPRSGTTFLSDCVAGVKNVEEFVGVLAPPRMMHLIGYMDSRHENTDELLRVMRDIFWQSFWMRRLFGRERVGQVVSRKKSVLSLFCKPSLQGALFCYKEPFLNFAMGPISQHFPRAKFIHIIRDGRDNADSMERRYPDALTDRVLTDRVLALNKNSEIGVIREHRGFFLPWWIETGREDEFLALSHYGRYVWMWKEIVSRGIAVGSSLGNERYLELRYESVVSTPIKAAEQIMRFLGFEVQRSLLRKLTKARTTSVGISKDRQQPERLREAQSVAGDFLNQLGYGG